MLAAALRAHLQLSHPGRVSCGGSSPGTFSPAQALGPQPPTWSPACRLGATSPSASPAPAQRLPCIPCAGTHSPPAGQEGGF